MDNQRTHHVTTTDGVTIGGTVRGSGTPAGVRPRDARRRGHRLAGAAPAPDRQVHLPSAELAGPWPQRRSPRPEPPSDGRRHPRLRRQHRETDRLVGWSSGAYLALLVAAAQSDAVDAVAPFEPGILSLMNEQEQAVFGGAAARMGELAAEGRLNAAARAFRWLALQRRRDRHGRGRGILRSRRTLRPNLLSLLQQWGEYEGPTPDDPAVLGAISAPVLVLHGADSTPFLIASARYVADRVPNARVHEILGAGHAAPS